MNRSAPQSGQLLLRPPTLPNELIEQLLLHHVTVPAHFIKDQDQPAPLVECRGSLPRTDQTISELCTGVLPNKQRLLNGGLVLEGQIHGAKKTGKRIEDLTRDSLAQNSES